MGDLPYLKNLSHLPPSLPLFHCYNQWHAGQTLTVGSLRREKLRFIAFIDFHGGNIPGGNILQWLISSYQRINSKNC